MGQGLGVPRQRVIRTSFWDTDALENFLHIWTPKASQQQEGAAIHWSWECRGNTPVLLLLSFSTNPHLAKRSPSWAGWCSCLMTLSTLTFSS